MIDRDLRSLERRTFRMAVDDGLWDVLIASVVALFAIAPLLSESLGDFWSSAVFLPVWLVLYLGIRLVRARVVAPRLGTVRFGPERIRRLRRVAAVLLIVNVVALALGVAAALGMGAGAIGDVGYPLGLALFALVAFTLVATLTGITRYYLYGLVLALAPLVGEWLWRNDLVAHHGYPLVFGVAACIILVGGLARFASVIGRRPPIADPGAV